MQGNSFLTMSLFAGELRYLLGEYIRQGLVYVRGRKVKINELTISRERDVVGAQAFPW